MVFQLKGNKKVVLFYLLGILILTNCKPESGSKLTEFLREVNLKYSLNFMGIEDKKIEGKQIGYMYTKAVRKDEEVVVTGETASDVHIGIGDPGRVYRLNLSYVPVPSSSVYNGFTLPFRLYHLAVEHQTVVKEVDILNKKIDNQIRYLIDLGELVYPDFTKLVVIETGSFALTGLTKRENVGFAGKKFSKELSKVGLEIEAREKELNKHIFYQAEKIKTAPANRDLPAVQDLYEEAVSVYQMLHPDSRKVTFASSPRFKSKGRASPANSKFFKEIVAGIVALKQAKILLAKTIFRIYEPHYLVYDFNLMGVRKKLNLAVTPEDTKKKIGNDISVIRYKMQAISRKRGNFAFGYADHDRRGWAMQISTSLKPLGKGKLNLVLEGVTEVN